MEERTKEIQQRIETKHMLCELENRVNKYKEKSLFSLNNLGSHSLYSNSLEMCFSLSNKLLEYAKIFSDNSEILSCIFLISCDVESFYEDVTYLMSQPVNFINKWKFKKRFRKFRKVLIDFESLEYKIKKYK